MQKLYFETPLYKKIEFTETDEESKDKVVDFINFSGKIHGYNPLLNENTSYDVKNNKTSLFSSIYANEGHHKITLHCTRTSFVITQFYYLECIEDVKTKIVTFYFQKIGQYPTIADLELGKYKKYSKVINKEYLKEFNKANGLSTHGVGIGAFVYLRRIFENLIEKYHEEAKILAGWDEDRYNRSKIVERIGLLNNQLPEAVVKYKNVYSIVSKGIHELEEKECLDYFPIIKDAILSMLEQDYLKQENISKQKELENNIQKIMKSLKQ